VAEDDVTRHSQQRDVVAHVAFLQGDKANP
jgi:hypothetical protein